MIVVLFCIYWTYFYLRQRHRIFPAKKISFEENIKPLDGESKWLEHSWGKTEFWWLPGRSDESRLPLVIVAHGQKGLIEHWEERLDGLRNHGFHCMLVEYPGYGRSEGRASESSLAEVFCAAYDWAIQQEIVEQEFVIGLGRSMGGGVISLLAERRRLAGLWLLSTFTSLKPFIRRKLIPSILLKDPLDTLNRISEYQLPISIIHGTEDTVVPHSHSEQLAQAAILSNLTLEQSAHHNCPLDWELFWTQAIEFTKQNHE